MDALYFCYVIKCYSNPGCMQCNRIASEAIHLICFHPSLSAPIMSEYNVKALTALRTELKTKIVMGPHLNDMLEKSAGGFMTRPEAQSVLSDSESQMGRLIDILKGKGDEEFRIFCKMLQKSNYPAWAEKLEQEAESFKSKVLGEGEICGIMAITRKNWDCSYN